jgi:hypothetical protein
MDVRQKQLLVKLWIPPVSPFLLLLELFSQIWACARMAVIYEICLINP